MCCCVVCVLASLFDITSSTIRWQERSLIGTVFRTKEAYTTARNKLFGRTRQSLSKMPWNIIRCFSTRLPTSSVPLRRRRQDCSVFANRVKHEAERLSLAFARAGNHPARPRRPHRRSKGPSLNRSARRSHRSCTRTSDRTQGSPAYRGSGCPQPADLPPPVFPWPLPSLSSRGS